VRIVVSGSQGFVGKHLRRALVARGVEVLGLDVPGSGAELEHDLGAEAFDADALADRVGRVFGVIYMAARITRGSSVDAPARSNLRAIAEAPVRLLEAFQRIDSSTHFVYCSTYKSYGPASEQPIDPLKPPQRPDPHSYGSAKALAERLLAIAARRCSARYAVVRPTCIYGPGQHLHNAIPLFLKACLSGQEPTVFGSGHEQRDDVLASDLSYCLAEACLRRAEGAFHATGERGRTILEVAELCCDAAAQLGVPKRVPRVDPTRAPKWWLDQSFDFTRTRQLLGYQPTPMSEGLLQEARWLAAGAAPERSTEFSPVRGAS
jgi:nucleoside-diphosphate-sugar epimerase